jgi:DsrE/DsrF/DsrH-like protein
MKAAIFVLSDPKSGGEEALGRVFNALAAAYEYKQAGNDVTVTFQGAGTRWVAELSKADHPLNTLFTAVLDTVAGVSCGCSDVFGAHAEAENKGFALVKDNAVPGTSGVASFRKFANDGYQIFTF